MIFFPPCDELCWLLDVLKTLKNVFFCPPKIFATLIRASKLFTNCLQAENFLAKKSLRIIANRKHWRVLTPFIISAAKNSCFWGCLSKSVRLVFQAQIWMNLKQSSFTREKRGKNFFFLKLFLTQMHRRTQPVFLSTFQEKMYQLKLSLTFKQTAKPLWSKRFRESIVDQAFFKKMESKNFFSTSLKE